MVTTILDLHTKQLLLCPPKFQENLPIIYRFKIYYYLVIIQKIIIQ